MNPVKERISDIQLEVAITLSKIVGVRQLALTSDIPLGSGDRNRKCVFFLL